MIDLLSFEPEGIDRIHQIDAKPVSDLPDPLHGVIKVADDLNRQRPVVESLRQLAVSDFSRSDKDDCAKAEIGRRTVNGEGRRCVARAGAGDPTRRNHAGMSKGRRHSIIFEAARGIHPLVLQPKEPGSMPTYRPTLSARCSKRLPFADGHDHFGRGERKQVTKSPDSREIQGIETINPLGLEIAEPAGNRQAIPIVDDIDQIAAIGTRETRLVDLERRRADGVDALLERTRRWSEAVFVGELL